MEGTPLLALRLRQAAFTFCLEQSDLVTASPNDETGGQTRAAAKEEGLQEHGGEVTMAPNLGLRCDAALVPVPGGRRRGRQDFNHSCCQTGAPSEAQLIA